MKNFLVRLIFCSTISAAIASGSDQITPYKFSNHEREAGIPAYDIPASSRFTVKRLQQDDPDIVCYMSKPPVDNYPIAILCGGSTSGENDILSIIHVHRYLLQEFMDIGAAVVTVEQRGVDGSNICAQEFMDHYTRTERLQDHTAVIDHFKTNPPSGWNGKFILLGVSEGGPIVTKLSADYSEKVIATINWCGAGDWSWREELWMFLEGMKAEAPWPIKMRFLLPEWMPFAIDFPRTRADYDTRMDTMLANPTADKKFLNMTYKYHADALKWAAPEYEKLQTPFLVVAGVQDTLIQSSDAFVRKAESADVPIAYIRVDDMDHYVRRRPDIVQKSFEWLAQQVR